MGERHRGKITSWKDAEGYGFITPERDGDDVFVHISSLAHRGRRPIGGEVVTYELASDERGRPRAGNVAFAGEIPLAWLLYGRGSGPIAFGLLVLGLMTVAVAVGRLPSPILVLALGASAVSFLVYAIDKSAARNGLRRVPESSLHLLGLIGGWPGAAIAQKVLHHKSSKTSFRVAFWATVVLHCVAVLACMIPSASRALSAILGSSR